MESETGDHVAYSVECDGDEHNECFDFDCPASHPVKMPEIHLYVRVLDYEGGAHMFSDGSDVSKYHGHGGDHRADLISADFPQRLFLRLGRD